MSEKRNYNIKCPKCQSATDVDLFESINVKTDPELRDLLMKNQINQVICSQCTFTFRVDKPLVYSDPLRRLILYWIPVPENQYLEGAAKFSDLIASTGIVLPEGIQAPEVHLVFTRTEMVERIFTVEAGLDARLVEYAKYLIYSKNTGRVDPALKQVLLNTQDSTPDYLSFVVQDIKTKQFEATLQYSREAYQALIETFGQEEKAADLLEIFPGPHISARTWILRESSSDSQAGTS